MTKHKNVLAILSFLVIVASCKNSDKENAKLEMFTNYYTAIKTRSADKWNFTTDTVKLWFDEKKGNPILQIKGKESTGPWKAWDEEMNSTHRYDSLWFDKNENSIKGYFYENNDFYKLIGKPPTKTLQTYWLNDDNKIHEILIYWIPEENTITATYLEPIVKWSMQNDATEIQQLYPNNQIIPSRENAKRWKKLLEAYSYASCERKSISTLKEPILDMEFILIPKGSFMMGNIEINEDSNSELPHKVNISKNYWLGKTEVTQNQWQKIMGNIEIHPEKPSPFRGVNPKYPIVSVSYFDIERFLAKLNELSIEYHFRLPTEAEWEYACRAGTTTPFSYGSRLTDTLANYNAEIPSKYSTLGNYKAHPEPVGSYAPNQWGLYDMHGNVWEWVSDWHEPYSEKEQTNPIGPMYGKEKVIRGGSWYFGAENAKSSRRRTHEPKLWGFSIGFRIVCENKY